MFSTIYQSLNRFQRPDVSPALRTLPLEEKNKIYPQIIALYDKCCIISRLKRKGKIILLRRAHGRAGAEVQSQESTWYNKGAAKSLLYSQKKKKKSPRRQMGSDVAK